MAAHLSQIDSASGGNRDNSVGSRIPPHRLGVGFVPITLVIGRVVATF
jgi:hypothetical protein